jgi:hypothetical protein
MVNRHSDEVVDYLMHESTIWNPHTTSNINKLESVQKNAARFVLNQPHDYKKPDSTTKMVKDLNPNVT